MVTQNYYLVREFARLAGVSVRTLHFYDRANLLKPSRYTPAKHRQYAQGDLLRLQQILTFKYLGFTLDEIRTLIDAPSYDLQRAINSQKSAIDARIAQLQEVSSALGRMLDVADSPTPLDWREARLIIAGVVAEGKQAWLQSYFTPEQLTQISANAAELAPDVIAEGTRQWQALAELFNTKRHLQPEHPEVQALAAVMAQLIHGFTRGDAGIAQSLRRMYEHDFEQIPEAMRLYDADLQRLMGAALEYYQATQAEADESE